MKSLKYIILSVTLFLVCIFTFCAVNLHKTYKEGFIDNDLTIYTENKLSKYVGGDKAQLFFPEYSEIQNAENIRFQYCDNTKKSNFFHKFYSYFCLDVILKDDEYQSFIENLEAPYEDGSEILHFTVLKEEFENSVCKSILCNDKTKTVRYVLFYGDFDDNDAENGIVPIMSWNMNLNQEDGSLS